MFKKTVLIIAGLTLLLIIVYIGFFHRQAILINKNNYQTLYQFENQVSNLDRLDLNKTKFHQACLGLEIWQNGILTRSSQSSSRVIKQTPNSIRVVINNAEYPSNKIYSSENHELITSSQIGFADDVLVVKIGISQDFINHHSEETVQEFINKQLLGTLARASQRATNETEFIKREEEIKTFIISQGYVVKVK